MFHLKAVGSGQDQRRKVLRWSIMYGESTETRRQYLEQTERLTFIISIYWAWRLTPHFSHANTSHLLPAPEKQKLNILLLSILYKVRLFNIRIIECNIMTFLSQEIVILGWGKCSQQLIAQSWVIRILQISFNSFLSPTPNIIIIYTKNGIPAMRRGLKMCSWLVWRNMN